MTARVRVVLATRNAHKVEEVRRILIDSGLDLDLIGLDSVGDVPEIAETGATFSDNALLKARAVAPAVGLPVIAEDSGICVDALNGMPGVLSARCALRVRRCPGDAIRRGAGRGRPARRPPRPRAAGLGRFRLRPHLLAGRRQPHDG
jgi:hypothetical protein